MSNNTLSRDDDCKTFDLWAGIVGLVVAVFLLLILIAAPLFQLSSWSSISVVVRLVGVIFATGILAGVVRRWLVGRQKGLLHNLAGLGLMLLCLAGSVTAMLFFYDLALVGRLGKAIGMASSLMALGSANALGQYWAARIQSRWHRK